MGGGGGGGGESTLQAVPGQRRYSDLEKIADDIKAKHRQRELKRPTKKKRQQRKNSASNIWNPSPPKESQIWEQVTDFIQIQASLRL